MGELEPECAELMAYYVTNLEKHIQIADACGIPRFSNSLQAELLRLLGSTASAQIVEAQVRIGDFANTKDLVALGRAVSRQLKTRGVPLRRGKRTAPGLLKLVAGTAPLLLRFGLPLGFGSK
jgi:hypothetical protein